MKLHKRLTLALAAIVPAVLFAAAETDRKIEDSARASYNYHTVLKDSVKVEAEDGVVILTGTVTDKELKNLAEDTVNGLPGVLRVDNRITVVPPAPEYSDDWLALKINTRLLLKANVSAVGTRVDVKDGVATLSGVADSPAQRELTENYVRDIKGIKGVKNELVVKGPAVKERRMGEVIDDASITAQVKYALLTHRSTSALNTKVSTRDGVILIEGVAANEAEKTLVTRLAEGVRGVKSVNNLMTVKG